MDKDKQMEADRRLKDGLDKLQPDYQAGSWDQLARRLDSDSLANTDQTDELLRAKLHSIAPAPVAASWALFQQKLTAETDSINASDELLRDKLQTLLPATGPQGWDKLASRLDNAESDDIFHLRLDAHAPTPPVSGWAALAARLELIAARRAAVYSYKFSELCLLVSALLLFWQFYPTTEAPSRPIAQQAIEEVRLLAESQYAIPEEEAISPTTITTVQSVIPTASSDKAIAINSNLVAATPSPSTTSLQTTGEQDYAAVKPIAYKAIKPLAQLPQTAPRPALNLLPIPKRSQKQIYLRSFVSPWDLNQVITPRQVVNDIILERDDRISHGASFGVLVDVAVRKHAMQYGVIYGRRSYIPTVLKDVEDFERGQGPLERRDTNYSRISFQTVSLPVSFQRELFNNGRWRIAGQLGLAADINVWSIFRKSPTFDQDVLDWSRQTSSLGNARTSGNINRIDGHDLVYPEQGLLQGGSLLENVNLSANVGFSIERQLNDRMSFYVAPRFSRAIYYQKDSGAEPFNDRIHNSSVQFGTRFLLSKRNK